ncbi:MAG: sigma-54-dependent Fis family transcriptional regulator [Myxococcaceae bacterium]
MPELVFLRRGEELLRVALDRSRMVLGRGATSDVVIPHPEVSPSQAAVLYDGRDVVLEDLSGKGTVVCGAKAQRASLPIGADIALGQWQAVVRELHSAPPPSPPEPWRPQGPRTVRVFPPEQLPAPRAVVPALAERAALKRPVVPARTIIGADPSIRQLAHFIQRVAESGAVVAIFGEPGSGRELVARAIHAQSVESDRPFIRVNCRAIDRQFLGGELFGRRGSFTTQDAFAAGAFGQAGGGTLFLDEVGELSLDVQAELLLRLESQDAGPAAVRVVAATNQDLLSATRAGLFLERLYDMLCLAPFVLPPLRSRRGDLAALAEHFVRCGGPQGQPLSIAPEALDRLRQHGWPGNIRELHNVIRRALLLRTGPGIEVADLHLGIECCGENLPATAEFVPGLTLEQMLRQREREIVESALRRFDNNRERVARELGVARSTLFKRLKDWGLTGHGEPEPPPGVSPAA